MGLPLHALQTLRPFLKGARVLSLSYPDLTIPEGILEAEFGIKCQHFTDKAAYHHLSFRLPETTDVFKQLGARLEVIDVVKATGMETIIDLNYPADVGQYDIVIDPGTLEHCFNIGQALINASQAVRPGGVIYHLSPMDMMNHGFYNLNPTLYHDYYTQNGWVIESLNSIMDAPNHFSPTKRFFAKVEHCVVCLATRRGNNPMKYVVQSKYLKPFAIAAAKAKAAA